MNDYIFDGPRGPIAVSVTGRGPCLILVAGLGATRHLWGDFPVVLSRRFTVITCDNRGVGEARGGEPFTIDGAAEDLLEAARRLGHDRFSMLGASLGGLIALRAVQKSPESCVSMVVASSAARLSEHGRRSLGLLRTLLKSLPPKDFGIALMSLAFAPPFQQQYPAFVDEAARLFGPSAEDLQGAIAQVEHMLEGWDDRAGLREVKVPTLVLAGLRDPIVAVEDTAEIADCMPEASFLALPDAGHSVLAEGGAEILKKITAFLDPASGDNTHPGETRA